MITKDVIERSPIRALERSIQGGLGSGKVGVVLGQTGVGKTACLVQIGLDALLRGRVVLHISNEAPVNHLRAWYDELFHEIERSTGLENASTVLLELERRRLLICQPGSSLKLAKLNEASGLARGALGRDPEVVLFEGFDFEDASDAQVRALRELAAGLGAEVWLSLRSPTPESTSSAGGVPAAVARFVPLVDVVLSLEPAGNQVKIRVLKDHDREAAQTPPLVLDAVTLQLIDQSRGLSGLDPRNRELFVLHSGGARGAEATFGDMAERYGIREIVFSFEGHTSRMRSRGLHLLTDAELRMGDVSLRYVSHRLRRVFPQAPMVRKVIQSIWHQVRPCQQIFVVGRIQTDDTVRGGTGWGAELARRWKKQLNVFDQERDGWFRWEESAWKQVEPVIDSPMFTGTGTANLEPNGRAAIEALFERSFGGSAPSSSS